jgi:P4 family phage/plasmid primase-like protien
MFDAEQFKRDITNGARKPARMPTSFARGDHAELADKLLVARSPIRDHIVGARNALYTYSPGTGLWTPCDRDDIRRTIKSFSGSPKGKNGTLNVTLAAAEGAFWFAYAEAAKPGFFEGATPGVAFVNGFASVESGRIVLRDHSPKHAATHGHPFAYDPRARCDELLTFLEVVFGDASEDDRAARIAFLQEHAGACLTGMAPKYQRCALLKGTGGNGKSKTEEIVYRGALPDGTVASLPPQLWAERFRLHRLIGCLANVCDEIPESEIVGSSVFKSAVSGEPVPVEEKHKPPFDAQLTCGHVFSCNALPATNDLTDGFFRRFVIIEFGRRFDNAAECDPDIATKVITACRPGIVAWALEGAARLQQQGRYTIPPSAEHAGEDWRRSADSVAMFVDECCTRIESTEDGTQARQLYRSYRSWAVDSGLRPVSSRSFKTRMEAAKVFSRRLPAGIFYPVTMT